MKPKYSMNHLLAIGLMSGTSMDGIDVALIKTNGENVERINQSIIYPYKKKTMKLLKKIIYNFEDLSKNKDLLKTLEYLITYDHFKAYKFFINKYKVQPHVIGFHGQTIFHNPLKKISIQLGNGHLLAELCKKQVIYNFRKEDIIQGGQGAPIAPIYHKLIIEDLILNKPCCFLNIGGVSNLTYWDGEQIIGFDTGPGNGLIDIYIQNKFNMPYDKDGSIASFSDPNTKIVKDFLKDQFFTLNYPKSLDRLSFYKNIFENKIFQKLSLFQAVSTLTELTIVSIQSAISILPKIPLNLIIMGGGQYNKYIVKRLKDELPFNVQTADEIKLPGKMIEAELIAFLAVRRLRFLPSTFPTTTGVAKDCVIGEIANFYK